MQQSSFIYRVVCCGIILVAGGMPALSVNTGPAGAAGQPKVRQVAGVEPRPLVELRVLLERAYEQQAEVTALTLEVAAHGSVEAVQTLLVLAVSDWRPGADAAVLALATMRADEVLAYLVSQFDAATADADWPTRVVVVRALGGAATGELGRAVLDKAAADRVPAVRIAAVQTATDSGRDPEAVSAIAATARDTALALGGEGRSHQVAVEVMLQADAQQQATRAEDDDDADTAQQDTDARRPNNNRQAANPRRQARSNGGGEGAATGRPQQQAPPTFFDTPVYSRNLLILIDTSGSMELYDVVGASSYNDLPRSPADNPRAVARGQARTANDRAWQRWLTRHPEAVRIQRVKLELEALLRSLPDDTRLNVVEFNSHAKPLFRDGMRVLGEGVNREIALSWTEGLHPGGSTNAVGAFEDALAMGDTRQTVDTVLFLSDGVPTDSRGRLMAIGTALSRINNLNYMGAVQIDTFAVGQEGLRFMRRLAEYNSGTFQDLNTVAP